LGQPEHAARRGRDAALRLSPGHADRGAPDRAGVSLARGGRPVRLLRLGGVGDGVLPAGCGSRRRVGARQLRDRGRAVRHRGPLPLRPPRQLPPALCAREPRPAAGVARLGEGAHRHPLGLGGALARLLQPLRWVLVQGADRPQHLALLDRASPRARGVRGAASARARSAAPLARGRGPARHVAGVAALPPALTLLAMATAGWKNTVAGVIAALTGPAVYGLAARRAPAVSR